jgi:hypothetical protein
MEDLLKKISNEYKAILRRSPDIGGSKNIFMSTYLMGTYLISIYKNTKGTGSVFFTNCGLCVLCNSMEGIPWIG